MFPGRLNRLYALVLVLAFFSGFMPVLRLHAAAGFDSMYSEIESANRNGSGSITLTDDISLSGALPQITGSITVDGNGYSISGANTERIFLVDGGVLTLRNVTLTEGYSAEDAARSCFEMALSLSSKMPLSTTIDRERAAAPSRRMAVPTGSISATAAFMTMQPLPAAARSSCWQEVSRLAAAVSIRIARSDSAARSKPSPAMPASQIARFTITKPAAVAASMLAAQGPR